MKVRIFVALGAALMTVSAQGQDIYKVESLSGEDLSGTARFVGMGGAMSSLGADISVMGTNPAGTGLFRRSDFSLSGSVGIQPNGEDFFDIGKSRSFFDQIGFVYAARLGEENVKFVNFGFNYHKRRNVKNYIGVNNFSTGGLSQSMQLRNLSFVNNGWLDLNLPGEGDPSNPDLLLTSPLTVLAYDTYVLNDRFRDGEFVGYDPLQANSYSYRRVQWGGIQQYDFNLSMNWNEQIYAGFTFGVQNVDIRSFTYYGENAAVSPNNGYGYFLNNEEALTGAGFDLKFGVILRPIEESPFRIGLSVHTPMFYDLTQSSYAYMESYLPLYNDVGGMDPTTSANDTELSLDYKIRTPWKFNLSMATTVGNFFALDAEYEYSNYGSSKISYPDYDDYWGSWSGSTKDDTLNNEIKNYMNSVSTFRIGAEARIAQGTYARVGYNYVSSPFKKDAYLNLFTDSPSYQYNTNTDYVNLGSINRVTCGVGFRGKHFYGDIAYQYQMQKGDLYTFHTADDGLGDIPVVGNNNLLKAAQVDLNRHNLMLTLGYKF